MKYYINPITDSITTQLESHVQDFIEDLKRNQNQVFDIQKIRKQRYGEMIEYSFKLISTENASWNHGGYWNATVSPNLFDEMFTLESLRPHFDDDLFEL